MSQAPDGRLAGRIALVTGASRGLGAAVARRLAREGAQTVLLARTQAGLEEVDDAIQAEGGAQPSLVPADVTDGATVDQVGAALFQRHGRLDVLVGNAGLVGDLSPLGHQDPETWEKVFATNVTANFRLIRSLDPLLRQSDAGRAVFMTCGVTDGVHPYWGAHAASKAALETMVRTWAGELGPTNIRANVLDPGPLRTGHRRHAFPGEPPDKAPDPADRTDPVVSLCEPACPHHGEVVRAGAAP